MTLPLHRTVLITGGSRGIGAATARLAATRGYAVAISYLARQQAADAVVRGIVNGGGVAMAVQADVSSEPDVCRLFGAVEDRLGRIDALVNNAGILDRQTTLAEMTAERIARILAVNVTGAFLCAREAVRRMSTAKGGRGGSIVNVSSGAARLGSPNEFIDYAASKGAVDTMTIGLAKEVAHEGIRVNAVRPGGIYTEMHIDAGEPGRVDRLKALVPMQRGGYPDEVARAILWLMSDEASYSTGSFIDVTGGR